MTPRTTQDTDGEEKQSFLCSYRFGLAILGFFVFLHNHMQRVSISVAILCMVNHTAVDMMNGGGHPGANLTRSLVTNGPSNSSLLRNASYNLLVPACGSTGDNGEALVEDGPFAWDKTTQGHVLSAYFYGYFIANFPAGLLSERFGAKWTLMTFYSVATVAMLLSPVAASVSPIFLIILRIVIGIGSGALFPCMHTMWSHWAPPMERSKLAGITYAGCMAAAMVGLPLSGVLCKYGFGQGWDSIFYIIGASSAVVVLLWVMLSSNSPSENNRVSEHEKRYIVSSLKGQINEDHKKFGLPWKDVMLSRPFWAIAAANFCSDWGLYTLLTNIPTFLSEVLKFNIQSNGVFSALPFLGLWINMNVSPIIADKLRSAGILSTTRTRKIFNTIGMVAPAVFLSALGFVECSNPYVGIILLVFGVTLSGCAYTGFLVNHMDIAPQYAGTLLGMTNTIGATSGFIAPTVAARLTTNGTRAEWQIVFFISAGVYIVGAIIYLIFSSGRIQDWARDESLKPETIELKNGHLQNGSVTCVDDLGDEVKVIGSDQNI